MLGLRVSWQRSPESSQPELAAANQREDDTPQRTESLAMKKTKTVSNSLL